MSSLFARVLIAPIRWYQRLISPLRPRTCRFHPTCSSYAVTALEVHGPFVGTWLAIRRLGRCHPWTPGGVDHVPPKGQWRSIKPPYDPRAGEGGDAFGGPAGESDGPRAGESATRSRAVIGGASSLIPAIASRSIASRLGGVRRAHSIRFVGFNVVTTMRRQGA